MFEPAIDRAFREAVAQAPVGVAVLLRSANANQKLILNATARSLLGWSDTDVVPGDAADFAFNLEVPRSRVTASRKDGDGIELEVIQWEHTSDGASTKVAFLFEPGGQSDTREARFRDLIEEAPDGIVVSRAASILYMNRAAVRLLGYDDASELIGFPITAFLDEDGRRRFVERVKAGGAAAGLAPLEYRAQRRDESWIVAEITSLPFVWEGAPAVVAFARDVTLRSRITDELKRADRLASLGTLSAGVAHEINNPLTFMTLGIELLSKRVQATSIAETDRASMLGTLAELRRGAERVAEIVRDLRTFSRADDQTVEAIDVRALVESSLRMVDHRARHVATVLMDVPGLPPVKANASRLEQVFVNLLLNACQALEDTAGTRRIEIRGGVEEPDKVFVEIIDNGPGISPEIMPRIFDPFFTTKTVGEGTGLGLAICHGIVVRCGGELSVESAPGRTVFRVVLPALDPDATGTSSEGRDQQARRLRILIVDDEPAIVRTLKRSLGVRHHVDTAGTANEAFALIDKNPYDVILCDLAMPDLCGIDIYERLAATDPALASRFAVMTGGAVSARTRDFLEGWPGPRIDKPFSIRKLEQLLGEVMGHADAADPAG